MDKNTLEFLRKQFPEGSRIKLHKMNDPYHPVPAGITGTLVKVDDLGQFQMKWDNGRTLSLIPGEDDFSILPSELTSLKLYMPLHGTLHKEGDWTDTGYQEEETEIPLSGEDLLQYMANIVEALAEHQLPEESKRGIMHWYDENDAVDAKVQSVFFNVEVREKELWGIAKCRVFGKLTDEELITLKDYIEGQASDGWGEGFEQRAISDWSDELYVSFWSEDANWSILTEEERFGPTKKEKSSLSDLIEKAEDRSGNNDRGEGKGTPER